MDPQVFRHPSKPVYVSVHVDDPVAIGSEQDLQYFFADLSDHVLIRVDEVVRVGDEFNYLGRRYMRTKHGFLKRPG